MGVRSEHPSNTPQARIALSGGRAQRPQTRGARSRGRAQPTPSLTVASEEEAEGPPPSDLFSSFSTGLVDGEVRPTVDLAPILLDLSARRDHLELHRSVPARVVEAGRGPFEVSALASNPDDWLGMLVLDGLLVVQLHAGRAHTGWVVGAEDLFRPWDMGELSLTNAISWRVVAPARIALLDADVARKCAGVPAILRALVTKTARTTNWLLAKSLILASPLVEERLLLAFALFGERWGTVNRDGVLLRLPLTHALLATICGVRRPSVTLALGELARAGVLQRTSDGGWLLHREVHKELKRRPACWPEYARALGVHETAAHE